jgi:hypothetical protein
MVMVRLHLVFFFSKILFIKRYKILVGMSFDKSSYNYHIMEGRENIGLKRVMYVL